MYLLNLPEYKLEDFFDEMLSNRQNNSKNNFLKSRLLLIKEHLIEEQVKYINLGLTKKLYEANSQKNITISHEKMTDKLTDEIPAEITYKEMNKVYTEYMCNKPGSKNIGRKVYDEILSNTDYNLCPYCSQRDVSTIDHYLPKSHYPLFSVTPANLIPSCSDCNKDKLDDYNLDEDKMLIHPYFDNLQNVNWLKCSVVKGNPITFSFEVSNEIEDKVLLSRLKHHFNILNLSKLYSDNAARRFRGLISSLIREYKSNPDDKVLSFINDSIDEYKSENPNSWEANMYIALKESNWFLEEALANLEEYK